MYFADDGFPLGLAFCLAVLRQVNYGTAFKSKVIPYGRLGISCRFSLFSR